MTTVDTHPAPPAGPETRVLSTDQLVTWRWRALSQQLPTAGFPAGSYAPALVYLWATMLVVVATALGFAIYDRDGVPAAVSESQQDLMLKVAHSLALTVTAADDTFDQTADSLRSGAAATPATIAGLTGENATSWAGVAILTPSTRKAVAASGEALPLNLIPGGALPEGNTPVMTVDGPAVIRVTLIGEDRALVGTQPLRLRNLRLNPDAQHGVYVLTPDGKNYLAQGVDAIPAGHRDELFKGVPGLRSSRSETIRVDEWTDRALVVSAAPIADTGFAVASVVVADIASGTSLLRALVLVLVVALTAAIAYALMRGALVNPLRQLLHQAKLDACGAVTKTRRSLRIAETYRVAQALAVSAETRIRGKRWRPTTLQGLSAAAVVALLGPAFAVTVALTQPTTTVPVQLNRDEESRAEAISNTLGNALNSGLQTVQRLARGQEAGKAALKTALDANHRLRGAYLIEPDGTVESSAGRPSLRAKQPVPGQSGVVLDPAVARLPVVYAYQVRPDGKAFVAEYDIDYLIGLMRGADGRAVVADPDLRTILDSEGYRAFQPLRDPTLRGAAVAALSGETISRSTDLEGHPALVAGTALTNPSVAHLEWVVVLDRDAASLQLPSMLERRWTLLMAAAATFILVVTLVWQYFIYVRPLRRLAAVSDRIVGGDFDEPVTPQRHDDVGAIAMCLEICRQVRHTGSARFGGAVRLRGTAANFTAVLPRPRIPNQRER
ncbi:MAG: HAMP domain-containing protein [Actinoplanes sp.]